MKHEQRTQVTEIKVKDYVVANLQDKKALIRVVSLNGDTIKGVHEFKDEEHNVEVERSDITANLGRVPLIGKVYGCNTERLIEVTDTKPIKVVEWYFNADEEVHDVVHEGIVAGAKLLRKHGLHHIFKVIKTKVVLNTAKTLTEKAVIGTYACKGASDENPDVMTLKFHPEMVAQIPRLICHEIGHGIWYRLMSPALQSQWIKAFFHQSEVEHFDEDVTRAALKAAVAQRSVILEDPEQQAALQSVLDHVKAATGLRLKDVWHLLQHDLTTAKAVLGPWMSYGHYSGAWETHVTDYGNTNVEEMWCEALANFCTGVILPDYLQELFDETIEAVTGREVYIQEED